MTETVTARLPLELDGVRADRAVAQVFGLSRAQARRLIDAGAVCVGDRQLQPAEKLVAGDELRAAIPPQEPAVLPVAMSLDIAYEDADLAVVAKPAGVVVHPGAGTKSPTLVEGLIARYPELGDMEEERWGLVHRLDRDTSGLLIVARNASAFRRLQADLETRTIVRTYLALVEGQPESGRGTIEAPLGRDPRHPTRVAVLQGGRHARTHYHRLASWDGAALLEVNLETGRTHQIRVHMASIGHPVVGDRVYGGRRHRHPGDPGRQWLHAARLEFRHPVDERPLIVTTPPPSDLLASLVGLGDPQSGDAAGWRTVVAPPTGAG